MLVKGEPVIVQSTGLGDIYCAVVEKDEPKEGKINPLVRVLTILQYPIQHAIMWPDVPNENPPLACGELARLTFMRRCESGEDTRFTYDESLQAALETAIRNAPTEAERQLLLGHRAGIFHKRRVEIRR